MSGSMTFKAEVAVRLGSSEIAVIDAGTATIEFDKVTEDAGTLDYAATSPAIRSALREALMNALAQLDADPNTPERSGWACPHGFSAARCAIDCTPTEPEHSHTACPRGYSAVRCLVKCPHTRPADPECTNHKPVQHRDGKTPWCNACGKTCTHPIIRPASGSIAPYCTVCGSFVAGRLSWHREPSSLPCAHVIPVDEGSLPACTKCGKTFHVTRTEGNAQQAPEQTRRQRARRRGVKFGQAAARTMTTAQPDEATDMPATGPQSPTSGYNPRTKGNTQ